MDVSEEDVVCVVFCCLCYCFCKDFFEQVDFGDCVVKVFCKVFECSESSDCVDFELVLVV